MLKLVYLDTYIIHNSQTTYTFCNFLYFKCMWRRYHYMYFYTPAGSANQPFNDHQVLVAFILYKQRMLCLVNKLCNPLPSVQAAPNKGSTLSRVKIFPLPVSLKA